MAYSYNVSAKVHKIHQEKTKQECFYTATLKKIKAFD